VRVRCYDESTGRMTYLRKAAELSHFMRALHDHFAELGVLERVRVAADEPADLEKFNRSLAFVHEAGRSSSSARRSITSSSSRMPRPD